jgi:hypothetical protein
MRQQTSAYVSIRQQTPAYVTSAVVSIRQRRSCQTRAIHVCEEHALCLDLKKLREKKIKRERTSAKKLREKMRQGTGAYLATAGKYS